MFNRFSAEQGDVLLFRSEGDLIGNGIAFFSNLGRLFRQGGKYVHAAIYIGNGKVLHSHLKVEKKFWVAGARETGVHIAVIDPEEYKTIDVFRVPGGIKASNKNKLINHGKKYLGKKYDLAAFPASFIRSVVARIFGFKHFRKGKPLLNDPDRWFCSELVSVVYKEALNIKINPAVHPMSQTPSDLAGRNSILKKVS